MSSLEWRWSNYVLMEDCTSGSWAEVYAKCWRVCVCVLGFVRMVLCAYWCFLPLKDCVVFLYANVLVDRGNREHSSFFFAGLLFWKDTQRCDKQSRVSFSCGRCESNQEADGDQNFLTVMHRHWLSVVHSCRSAKRCPRYHCLNSWKAGKHQQQCFWKSVNVPSGGTLYSGLARLHKYKFAVKAF